LFFCKLLQLFEKACESGFDGFVKWIRSLLSKEKKHLDEALDEIEQISLKNYSKTEISTLLLQNNINKFYNSSDLDAIYKKALQLDMRLDDLIGFVKTGNIKEIKSVELLKQMDNYINIVLQRGYPFGFRNLKEFEQFCDILKSELSSIALSTNDIRIQGSSVRSKNPNDIDIAIFLKDKDLDIFINKTRELRKEKSIISGNPKFLKNYERRLSLGKINSFDFPKIKNDYFDLLKNNMFKDKKVQISVIIENSSFDVSPYLKLKK